MVVEDKKYVKMVRDNYANEKVSCRNKRIQEEDNPCDAKPIQTISNRIYELRNSVCVLEECLRSIESKMFTDTLKLDVEDKSPCCSETLDEQLDLITHHANICFKIADSINTKLA